MGLGLVLNRNRQVPAEDSPAFGAIAERFRRAGDLERAVALCQEGLQRFPAHVSARVTLGWSYLDLGRYEEARAELEQVLKRAPDNLAAIRGLAELHDRSEHDEVAAIHKADSKWMSEAAAAQAAAPVEDEPPASHAGRMAAHHETQLPSPGFDPADDDQADVEAEIAALSRLAPATPASPVVAPATATTGFAHAEPPRAPAPASPVVAPAARPAVDPEPAQADAATSPWAPVQIESAADRVLQSTVVPTKVAPEPPSRPAEPASAFPVAFPASPEPAHNDFAAPTQAAARLATPVEVAAAFPVAFPAAAEPVAPAPAVPEASAPVAPTPAVAPVVAATRAPSVPVVATPAPVEAAAVELPALSEFAPPSAQPTAPVGPVLVPTVEEHYGDFDPVMPPPDDSWSEMLPDVYVLPAAVEAARSAADEGPGPWPPVIEDDPAEAPGVAERAAEAAAPAVRRPAVQKLNQFLRRVETRRSAVVAQYLAG